MEGQWPGTAAAMGPISKSAGVPCRQLEAGDDPENPAIMNGETCASHVRPYQTSATRVDWTRLLE